MSLSVPTVAELFEAAKQEVLTRDPTLTDWSEGSNLDALTGANAVVGDETMAYGLRLHRARFLDLAVGEELDALGVDRYNTPRLGDVAAIGHVMWHEGSATGYLVPAGTTVRGTLDDGTPFDAITTADAQSDDGQPIPVQAAIVGRGGNIPAGTLGQVVSFPTDATATVTQPYRLAGGALPETDEQYRTRLRLWPQTLTLGVRLAYERAARSVGGVAFVRVVEVQTTGALVVRVYVADAEGASNPALVALVAAAVEEVRALGVQAQCIGAEREEIALVVELLLADGIDPDTTKAAIQAALRSYTDNLPAGAPIFRSKVGEVCHAAARASLVSATMTVPRITPTSPYNSLRLAGGAATLVLVAGA